MSLKLHALEVGYRGALGAVLSDIDLCVSDGAFICILGRNGAGKSTLMRTIAGLQPPLGGQARLGDADIHALRAHIRARRIAVVLTERSFSPGLTVEDVVSLGRQPFTAWQGRLTDQDRSIAERALQSAGAAEFRGRYVDDLSDGERQRVMIARAIAQSAPLMILDEITAFLDLPGRVEMMALLRRYARETGTTVLLSSHDLDLSLQLADTVWLVADGRVEAGGSDVLAESGALAAAFDSPDIAFSSTERRFEISGAAA